jgi:hypothetical protein
MQDFLNKKIAKRSQPNLCVRKRGVSMEGKEETMHKHGAEKKTFSDFWPLICIILISFIGGYFLEFRTKGFEWKGVFMTFMGFFFVILSMLKFFDVRGFAEGFSQYDLVTQSFKPYAYFYPFIELALGLLFFAQWVPVIAKILTIVVMGISACGVFKALIDRKKILCACMGTTIRLPLTVVSLVENVGMGVLALIMLF